jgi:dihydroorotase
MIIRNVALWKGNRRDFHVNNSGADIDGTHLTALPALIDPHVHFRVPGLAHKEDWHTGAKSAIAGGYTTVFDMPNTRPATVTKERLLEKKQEIDRQLAEVGLPLHYELFFGADKKYFAEIGEVAKDIIGVKIFMGASTGDLLMDDESSLHAMFALAAHYKLLIAVHAEDEEMIQARRAEFPGQDFALHSKIRSPEVAEKAVSLALRLAETYGVRLYLLHVSSRLELEAVAAAKARGVAVFVETCPHYLFLTDEAYATLHGHAQMNPALRSKADQSLLWEALRQGLIDTIGSDHAPHTLQEKAASYGACPSGVPGIQTTLPLLLNAYHQGQLTLADIVRLTHDHPKKIFNQPDRDEWVLVDLNRIETVRGAALHSKAGWTPFEGQRLQGWPCYTILEGHAYATF